MPPLPSEEPAPTRLPELLVRHVLDHCDAFRMRVATRIRGIETIDIRQQHQTVRHDQLCDACGEPIVIAVAQLVGCDGVVLVYDRHDTVLQQFFEGSAGVQEPRLQLGIVRRQQDLGDIDTMTRQCFLVGIEPDAPGPRRQRPADAPAWFCGDRAAGRGRDCPRRPRRRIRSALRDRRRAVHRCHRQARLTTGSRAGPNRRSAAQSQS